MGNCVWSTLGILHSHHCFHSFHEIFMGYFVWSTLDNGHHPKTNGLEFQGRLINPHVGLFTGFRLNWLVFFYRISAQLASFFTGFRLDLLFSDHSWVFFYQISARLAILRPLVGLFTWFRLDWLVFLSGFRLDWLFSDLSWVYFTGFRLDWLVFFAGFWLKLAILSDYAGSPT